MIRPPKANAPDKIVQRWRWIVSGLLVVLTAFMVWATGIIPRFDGVALAADVVQLEKTIDAKVQHALIPVNMKLDQQEKYLKRLVSKDIRADIFEKLTAYCTAPANQKARLREDIDTLQDEYKEATDNNYPEPRCEDI